MPGYEDRKNVGLGVKGIASDVLVPAATRLVVSERSFSDGGFKGASKLCRCCNKMLY